MEIHFKKGVYKLNEQSNFDFQLNRVVMWDGGDLERNDVMIDFEFDFRYV